MSKKLFVAIAYSVSGVVLVLMIIWSGWLATDGNVDALLLVAGSLLVLLLGASAIRIDEAMSDKNRKDLTRHKRQLEEYHLTTEKLEYDANQARAERRQMFHDLQNRDRILLRMAQVLETSMDAQLQELSQPELDRSMMKLRTEQMRKYGHDLEVLAGLTLQAQGSGFRSISFDVQLHQSLKQLADIVQHYKVDVEIQNEEEQILIQANDHKLTNLLSRIMETGIRLSKNNKLVIELITYLDGDMGECVRMKVVTHGRGLSPHEQQQIFQQYLEIIDQDGEDISPGLSPVIANELVKSMSGRLSIQSHSNQEAEFLLLLPLKEITKEAE
jgi:signal transduction histidine kinase